MKDDSHLKETIIESNAIFKGNVIDVKHEKVRLPNNKTSYREIAYHKGAVALIVVHDNYMYFVKQYRLATREVLLEVPAGKIEINEAPDLTAEKELKEEIGAKCQSLKLISEFYAAPGFSNEFIRLYQAEGLVFEEQALEADEFLDIVKIPLNELPDYIKNNKIKDAKTLIAVQFVMSQLN